MAVDAGNIQVTISADTAQLASGLATASRIMGGFATNAGRNVGVASNALQGLSKAASSLTPVMLAAGAGVGALALGAAASVAAAVRFESAWAGALKTLDGTPAQLQELRTEILGLSTEIPVAATALAGLAEVAGQLGVATEDVREFVEVSAMLGETTSLSAEMAATSLARLQNIMELPRGSIDDLGNALVELGNNFAANESEILGLTVRLAPAAQLIGMTAAETMGLSTAMKSLGLETESGATAVSRSFLAMESAVQQGGIELENFARVAGMTSDSFADLFEEDPAEAFQSFLEGLASIDEQGGNTVGTLEELGLGGQRVMRALLALAGGADQVEAAIAAANDEMANGSALSDEFAKRQETTAARLKVIGNQITAIAIGIGTPINEGFIKPLLESVTWLLDGIIDGINWLNANTGDLNPVGPERPDSIWGDPDATREAFDLDGSGAGFRASFSPDEAGPVISIEEAQAAQEHFGTLALKVKEVVAQQQMLNQATKDFSFPDAASLGIDNAAALLGEVQTEAEAAARAINTMTSSFNGLQESIAGIEAKRDIFQFQTENLQAATIAADGAREAFAAGEITIEEYAGTLGDLNVAYAASGVSADQAAAFQATLVDELAAVAEQAGLSSTELQVLSAQYLTLSGAEIADLTIKGQETWFAAVEQMGILQRAAEQFSSTEIVAQMSVDTGKSEEEIQALLDAGDEWALQTYLAYMNADVTQARDGIQNIMDEAEAYSGVEYAAVFNADSEAAKGEIATVMVLAGEWDVTEARAFMDADTGQAAVKIAEIMVQLGFWDQAEAIAYLRAVDEASPTVNALQGYLDTLPEEQLVELLVEAKGEEEIAALQRAIDALEGKTIDVIARIQASGSGGYGISVLEDGGLVEYYAGGGMRENHIAQIAPAGAYRVWAEPETGGEAYIPLAPAKRARSSQILSETARRMGKKVVNNSDGNLFESFAEGGFSSTSGGAGIDMNLLIEVNVDTEALGSVSTDLDPLTVSINEVLNASRAADEELTALGITSNITTTDLSLLGTAAGTTAEETALAAQAAAELGSASERTATDVSLLGGEMNTLDSDIERTRLTSEELKDSWDEFAATNALGEAATTAAEEMTFFETVFTDATDTMIAAAEELGAALLEELTFDEVVDVFTAGVEEVELVLEGLVIESGATMEELVGIFAVAGVDISEALTEGIEVEEFLANLSAMGIEVEDIFEALLILFEGDVADAVQFLIDLGIDLGDTWVDVMEENADAVEIWIASLTDVGDAMSDLEDSVEGARDSLDLLNSQWLTLVEAELDFIQQQEKVNELIDDSEESFDRSTAAGAKNYEQLIKLAESAQDLALAYAASGVSADEAGEFIDNLTEDLIEQFVQAGLTREEAEKLALAYLGFPEEVITLITVDGLTAQEAIEEYNRRLDETDGRVVETTITADTEGAEGPISTLNDDLDGLANRVVSPKVRIDIGGGLANSAGQKIPGETFTPGGSGPLTGLIEDLDTLDAMEANPTVTIEMEAAGEDVATLVVDLETLDATEAEPVVTLDAEPAQDGIDEMSDSLEELAATETEVVVTADTTAAADAIEIVSLAAEAFATTPYEAILTADNTAAVGAIGDAQDDADAFVDDSPYHAVLTADSSQARGEIGAAVSLLDGFSDKSVTLSVTTVYSTVGSPSGAAGGGTISTSSGGTSLTGSKSKFGFADGGVLSQEDHIAQIARAGGPLRVWAEPETGGEAYIPLAQHKRAQSMAILEDVARMFGQRVMPFANGGGTYNSGGSSMLIEKGAVQVNINGGDNPRAVARAVDEQITHRLKGFSRELATSTR